MVGDIIRQAVADMLLCDADPRYQIDMSHYHYPKRGKCSVCLAGAYLAQTLKADAELWITPDETEHENTLRFLDLARCPHISLYMVKYVTDLGYALPTTPYPLGYVRGVEDIDILLARADWFDTCTLLSCSPQ